MVLTRKQEEGLKIAVARFRAREKYTVISGYAGTGKSTLVRFIVDALGVDEKDICYATFTGKAAQVLLSKGNKNVSTLHKLLFKSRPKPDGTFIRVPVDSVPYTIVIVDEVSMAPKSLMKLLFSFPVHVICLGDSFQLPPVSKDDDNHLLDKPHIFLDEIMRQAAESEIIRLSMEIREQRPIRYQKGNEVMVLNKNMEFNPSMLNWADQILVGTNATRIGVNNHMREKMNRGNNPEDGDKVICLRNYWGTFSEDDEPLVNGTIGFLNNSFDSFVQLPRYLGGKRLGTTQGDFITDFNSEFKGLSMDTHMILTGEKCVDSKLAYRIYQNKNLQGILPLEFTYGYAITVHKAQGSQFDKVLVLEERFPYDREEHARWLYTAVTRASEKLVLVR